MTRKERFYFIDHNTVTDCIFKFLKEEPTAEVFFYMFKISIVNAENLRNINKLPAVKKLNDFRLAISIRYFRSITARIDVNKPDISEGIELLSDLSYKGLIDLDIIPINVFENIDFTKLTEKKILAIMKLYKD
jgi:hypothetical protein